MSRALVVVSTFERLNLLRLSLAAWRRQTVPDFTLAVADDGSGEATASFVADFARSAPFPVLHVRQAHDGFRKARIVNEAIRRAERTPLVVLTDGDCPPPAAFLERHLAAHGKRTFAVGGAVRVDQGTTERLTLSDVEAGAHERLATREDVRDLRRRAWKSRVGVWLRLPRRPKVLGLNVGIDRGLLEEANGYDEAFEGYGLEDSDLRDRVMRLSPRPAVRILYGRNDTVHLWHPPTPGTDAHANRAYYESNRPARCVRGLSRGDGERAPRDR